MWKKEFDLSYCGFTEDGAEWLVKNTDIKLIGELKASGPLIAIILNIMVDYHTILLLT